MIEQLTQKAVIYNMAFSEGSTASYEQPGLSSQAQREHARVLSMARVAPRARRFRQLYAERWMEGYQFRAKHPPTPETEILTY